MIYYILAILVVIAVRLVIYLKYLENGIRQNKAHEILTCLFSIYIAYIFVYLRNIVYPKGLDELRLVVLFLPIGFFMPMVFKRFKFFLLNIFLMGFANVAICFIQYINLGKTNYMNILFSLFGVLVGFLCFAIISEIITGLKKNFIMEKRRRMPKFIIFEPEVTVIAILLFILISSSFVMFVEGNNKDKTKGEATSASNSSYSDIYYAEKDLYSRYDAYARKYPDMSIEDVVWRVDANLDQAYYDEDYVTYVDKNDSSPLLINKFNRVSDDYEPTTLVNIEGDYVATPATATAYNQMLEDMKQQDMVVYIVSSYRSVSYQDNLYKYYLKKDSESEVDTYSSRPGYSEHHTGRALDISQVKENLDKFEGSDEAKWVYENCYKYGFIVRYKAEAKDVTGYIFEPWHITYVGKEISTKMHDENIDTLEEYVVKYVDHHQ